MNAVDWSQAPEGAVAYITAMYMGADKVTEWLVIDADHRYWTPVNRTAPDFGLPLGVVTRPSTAETELRIKADMWKSIHDDLFNVAEQIKSERDQLRAEVDRLRTHNRCADCHGESKITDILLAHIGLDDSAAFTESGVPNPGRLRSILAELAEKRR